MSKRLMSTVPALLLTLVVSSAYAQQTFVVSEVEQVSGTMSLTGPTTLAVKGRKLNTVNGWSDEVHTEIAPTGVATFFLNDPHASAGKTITLVASDDGGGTYTLNLRPNGVPSELITLKPKQAPSAGRQGADTGNAAPDYERAIKNMILTMARSDKESDMDFVPVNKEIPLWKEGRLIQQRKYIGDSLVGEKYFLTNISANRMVLAEQELYRPGVVSVAIETHNLQPGASTVIYIVRGKEDNE